MSTKLRDEADERERRARWNPWAEDRYFQTGWSKLWFALFGELKFLYWIVWGALLSQLALYGVIIWVALHFINKYW